MRPGLGGEIGGEALDEITPAPRIDDARRARFLLQEQLRVAGDAGGKIGGQRQRLVERIRVQRLGSPLRCRHRLDAGARHIVEHILGGETPAGSLAMGAKRQGALVFRVEALDELGPDHPRGPHLRHFHEEIHADGPKEREAWRELVDAEPHGDAGLGIFESVRQCVGKFEIGGRSGFLHVIAGDRDRVEFRHPLGGIFENVGNDPHRLGGRIDESVPHHELFQDVVLDGAGELFRRHALFLARHDIERHDRQHGAVHGHRHRHLVERDAIEQGAHVVDRIDGDAGHADITRHPRMVRIITAMGGEIEGDGEAHLPGFQIAAVEGVGILRRREPRILPDGPGLRRIHGGVGAPEERRQARPCIEEVDALHVPFAVGTLDVDPFGRRPRLA